MLNLSNHKENKSNNALKLSDLMMENKFKEASLLSGKIYLKNQNDYNAAINHAMVLLASNNANEAIKTSIKAFEIDKNQIQPFIVICRSLISLGEYMEASRYALAAHEKWPDRGEPILLTGITLARLRHHLDAEKWLIKALNTKNLTTLQNAEAYFHLGQAISNIDGRDEEALKYSHMAIENEKDNPLYHMALGNIYASQNEPQKAQQAFDKALSLNPLMGSIYWNKSRSKKFNESDSDFIAKMQKLYIQGKMHDTDRVLLGFSLAKAYKDLGYLEEAIDCWNTANAVQKSSKDFDINFEKLAFADFYGSYPFNQNYLADTGKEYPTPIFIVGMPRSGTTLAEQIIGSHSRVTPLGELEYLARIVNTVKQKCGGLKSKNASELIRKLYFSEVRQHDVKTDYFTDKMPLNFRLIPLIVNAFPEAKIIHCDRDPMAVCFSNFSNFFAADGMLFTCGQKEIATYYNLYKDYMDLNWSTFGSRLYRLDYKNLTENQYDQTNLLLENCDLKFEMSCINFQENNRSINTASQRQIRQGMYQGSTEGWKKYKKWLAPMIETLEHYDFNQTT
jgi:tetratricopeptide (TPR) repeat protein